jgi:peptidoglycan/xylan/chitin deacetylase (PgdA/CDA1 family)
MINTPITRRIFLKTAAALVGGLLLPDVQDALANPGAPPTLWHGNRNLSLISLSFDDCYLINSLRELEKLCDAYPSMKLTFFPVGVALLNTNAKDQGIWKRLVSKGHEVGYHSYDHNEEIPPSKMSDSAMLVDYERWYEVYSQVVGDKPVVHFARPPFGDLSYSFLNLCAKKELTPAMWSVNWGKTFKDMQAEVKKIIKGDVILLHIRNPDVDNLRHALPFLHRSDLQMVTLSDLLYMEVPSYEETSSDNNLPGMLARNRIYPR